MKKSVFIGQFNKLLSNFGHLSKNVLCRLLKSYCYSFYGSQLWYLNSRYFDKLCKTWNKAVRRMLNLPYRTHTWILSPLMNQLHIHNNN